MRVLNRLTEQAVKRHAKAAEPGKKLSDGGSLYLMRTPAGSAVWRVNYKLGGKARTFALGVYPEISLAEARKERARVRELLRQGKDPNLEKREARLANIRAGDASRAARMLSEFAADWLADRRLKKGWSEIHARQVRLQLDRYLLRDYGRVPVPLITQPMMLEAARKLLAKRRYETCAKFLQNTTRLFESARFLGLRPDNPAAGIAEHLIPSGIAVNERPALTKLTDLGGVLRGTDAARISPVVRLALQTVAFTASRIGPVLQAEWREFDLGDDPTWTVPRRKMKEKRRKYDHVIPLGPTIAAALRAWRSKTAGKGYVFPAPGGAPHLRHETLEKVYRRTLELGDRMSVHGWRSAFSTIAREARDKDGRRIWDDEVIDAVLDHSRAGAVQLAYDRRELLEEKRRLLFWWDSQLSAAQHGTKPLTAAKTA
ncbi:tyrosine-type recombinase/integrase [soil metagenome]